MSDLVRGELSQNQSELFTSNALGNMLISILYTKIAKGVGYIAQISVCHYEKTDRHV